VTWTEVREKRSLDYARVVERMIGTVPEEVAADCQKVRKGYRLFKFTDLAEGDI
jgi:hypothetical protein